MSKKEKITDTEKRIIDTTIFLLVKEGKFGITMNEIAEKSKVGRTAIHYYYRSKENLISITTEQILDKLIIPRYQFLFNGKNLKDKVENYLNDSKIVLGRYPYTDIYVMTHFNESESIRNYFDSIKNAMQDLLLEIEEGIEKKVVISDSPFDFMTDLFSLSIYSWIYLNFLDINKEFMKTVVNEEFLNERNERILKRLFI